MGRELELKSGTWRAVVTPERGGRLKWLGEARPTGREPWLRPMTSLRGRLVGGAMPCLVAPSGVDESMARLIPDPDSFEESWQVIQQLPDRATLMLHPEGPSPGGWRYQASQTLRLDEHRLEWDLSVRNLGRMPMPARLGWLLDFPDDFAESAWLDDTLDVVRQPRRGQVEQRDPWCGLATLNGAGGRMALLRGAAPLDTLRFERLKARASVQLRLMTPDSPRMTPLARGEEVTLRLTLDLLRTKLPALPRPQAGEPPGPLIL